jgi:hypothetical protein
MSLLLWRGVTRSSRLLSELLCTAWPVWHTFRALQRNSDEDGSSSNGGSAAEAERQKWATFWLVCTPLLVLERLPPLSSGVVWLPGYAHAKLALVLFLCLPRFEGAQLVWSRWMAPWLAVHEAAIDARLEAWRAQLARWAAKGSVAGVKHVQRIMALLAVRLAQVLSRSLEASKQARLSLTRQSTSSSPSGLTPTLLPPTSRTDDKSSCNALIESGEHVPLTSASAAVPLLALASLGRRSNGNGSAEADELPRFVGEMASHAQATVCELTGHLVQQQLEHATAAAAAPFSSGPLPLADRPALSDATALFVQQQQQQQQQQQRTSDIVDATAAAFAPDAGGDENACTAASSPSPPRPAKLSFVHSRKPRGTRVSFATVE